MPPLLETLPAEKAFIGWHKQFNILNGHSLFENLPTVTNNWNIQSTMECVLLLKSET